MFCKYFKEISFINRIRMTSNISKLSTKNKYKVLITHNGVPEAGFSLLRRNNIEVITTTKSPPERDEILELSAGVDGILWGNHEKLNAEALDAAGPSLKVLSTMSAGIDYVDLPEIRRRNVPIGYTPKVLDEAVADIAIGLMIAAARRFHEGRLKIESSDWIRHPQWMLGLDIRGSTVGIVGFGNIGQCIARRLQGFNIGKLIYSGHSLKPEAEIFNAEFVSFNELLEKSDFIIIACPLTNETREMFNAKTFAKMKSTSVLINIARGQIVNQDDLIVALKNGKIFAAGLDVVDPEPLPADHELMKLPNLVLIPHLGSATTQTRDQMAMLAAQNIVNVLNGERMVAPVP